MCFVVEIKICPHLSLLLWMAFEIILQPIDFDVHRGKENKIRQ